MSSTRVGIIRHIDNPNFEKTSGLFDIFQNELNNDKYKLVDIFIDDKNTWHHLGIPILPMDLHHKVDLIWNENDPHIAQTLSHIGIPHISRNAFHILLEKNKNNLKKYLENLNISAPRNLIISPYQKDIDGDLEIYAMKKAKEVWNKFSPPYTLHASNDKDMGIFTVKTFDELSSRLYELLSRGDTVLVEEIIFGDKNTFHFLPNFRNQDYYSLSPLALKKDIKDKIEEIAKTLINNLGIKHYLKIDFIIKGNTLYIDNINTNLNLQDQDFKGRIHNFGIKNKDIIEHIFKNATI